MIRKKILIIGFQKASMKLFYDSLNFLINKRYKVTFYKGPNFKKKITLKEPKNTKYKFLHKYDFIITGTSETLFEKNIWRYCDTNNIQYAAFVDSVVNIKQRFSKINKFPKSIFITSNITESKIKKIFPIKSKATKIINIGFISHIYLKKILPNKPSQKNILYVTSDINFKYELEIIKKFIYFSKIKKNILYICIHPRENLELYKSKIKNAANIKIYQNKLLKIAPKVSEVFGVSTMALLDMKAIGKRVFYYKNRMNKDNMHKLFSIYGLGNFRLRKNKIIKLKKNLNIRNVNNKIILKNIYELI